jgi:hypothetical protein
MSVVNTEYNYIHKTKVNPYSANVENMASS